MESGLHERRVCHRARDALDVWAAAPVDNDAANPHRPLSVADDRDRERAQQPVQGLTEAKYVVALWIDGYTAGTAGD